MRIALLSLLAIAAAAQDQTGRIEGVVLDSISRQPVKKAVVSVQFIQDGGPQTVTTDSSGAFAFSGLAAGQYELAVMHQNYPQGRFGGVHKTIQVSAGETASSVSVELIPGAAVSGQIVDEDGDPLSGCFVQLHPAKNFSQGVQISRTPIAHEDGSYRLSSIPPGKYTITAQCTATVFQPRALSEGPDPPPSAAYPVQFYSATSDLKSAQILELLPGAEKSGVDFQMRPVPVTHIHGTLTVASADWRGRSDLRIQLLPLDPRSPRVLGFGRGGQVSATDGSFELETVFPGSYRLVVFSQDISRGGSGQPDASNLVGAIARVDVADKPVNISLPLHRAMDISGTIEIERNNNTANQVTLNQIGVQLSSDNQFGGEPTRAQVNEDGTFTVKSVLPGEWRIMLMAPNNVFVKSVRLGADEVVNRKLDLTSGSAAPLRIVASNNTANVKGTAQAGQMVFCTPVEEGVPMKGWRATQTDSSGQFAMQGLAPGKYRIVVADNGASMPEEGGQELTLGEGETATIDVKPESKP
jgi:protocatechuate 3,4-dioxygenase beta subunit